MTALLATSGWHHHWFWLWPLVPLLCLLVFFALARLSFRRTRRAPWAVRAAAHAPDPRQILAERYARGEIDHDEYRERLGHLDDR
jgi:putative membrane protein